MSKNSHRKNHKQKLATFKQKRKETENRTKKMQQMFVDNYIKQQESARKEYMVETIYMNRNELVKEVDGIWTVNEDAVESQNDMLVWKSDGNPILAGLESSIEAYSEYTVEYLNTILPQIQSRLKWKADKDRVAMEGMETTLVTPADLGETIELIEDPNFVQEAEISEIVESSTDEK